MSQVNKNSMYDKEGFLIDLKTWSETIAHDIARSENIVLSNEHWEIIFLLRDFYAQFQRSPNMRALVNFLKKTLDAESSKQKANSIYLLKLFPESPAKIASKIAGLPKPENCL